MSRTNTRLKVLLEFVAELLDVMITMKMVIHSMTSSLIRQDMHSHSSLLLKCLYFIQFSYYGYPRSFFKVFQEIRVFAGLLYLIDLIKREAPKNVLQYILLTQEFHIFFRFASV